MAKAHDVTKFVGGDVEISSDCRVVSHVVLCLVFASGVAVRDAPRIEPHSINLFA